MTDLGPALVDGPAHGSHGRLVLPADVEDDLVGADGLRRQVGPVNHEMRPMRHQDPVLGAGRLALGTVHQDDGRAALPFGQGTPLATDREAGAAAAEQPACLEARDEIEVVVSARKCAEPREMGVEALGIAIQWRAGEKALSRVGRVQRCSGGGSRSDRRSRHDRRDLTVAHT